MSRTTIGLKIEIDMGHRIPGHTGKCRGVHGHRYVFEAEVAGAVIESPGGSAEGMVLDFGDLKALLVETISTPWDHGLMLYERDPILEAMRSLPGQKIVEVPFIPTAERIAAHAFQLLAPPLKGKGLHLRALTVWETPSSWARCSEDSK